MISIMCNNNNCNDNNKNNKNDNSKEEFCFVLTLGEERTLTSLCRSVTSLCNTTLSRLHASLSPLCDRVISCWTAVRNPVRVRERERDSVCERII